MPKPICGKAHDKSRLNVLRVGLALIFAFLALNGCLSKSSRQIDYYALEYSPPEIRGQKPLPVVLRIDSFRISPLYDTKRIIYQEKKFKKDAYAYHRWWAKPNEMVTDYLARDFQQSALFKAVFVYDRSREASHVLKGTVEEFYENDRPNLWEAVMGVNIALLAENEPMVSKKILLQKKYVATQPCSERKPEALAEAMSQAMSQISEAVLADVHTALKKK